MLVSVNGGDGAVSSAAGTGGAIRLKQLGFNHGKLKPVLEMEPRLREMIRREDLRAEESPSSQQEKLKSVQPMCQANGFPMKAQSS